MNTLLIQPNIGIGDLKLGMTPDELEHALLSMRRLWDSSDNAKPDIFLRSDCLRNELDDPHWITGRYFDGCAFFLVQYYDGRAVEIGVERCLSQTTSVLLDELDVFALPAEELVCALKQKSSVLCDLPDEQLATNYEFPELGIRLWRESAFHPKLLKDEQWMQEMQLVLEEEMQYLYFGLVAVRKQEFFG